jgi:mono/diheme cytochrome c family protein
LLFLAVLAAGCDFPGRPVPPDQVTDADRFGALYTTRCAGCHGADGKLGPAPPLNDPIFLAIVPDDELLRVIREGRTVTPGQRSPMPGFARDRGGPLTGAEVKVLAEGIKKRWGPPASPSSSVPAYAGPAASRTDLKSVPPSGGTKEDGARVARGRESFARACAGCHGPQGQGEKDGHV